jgi:hypothetical protein
VVLVAVVLAFTGTKRYNRLICGPERYIDASGKSFAERLNNFIMNVWERLAVNLLPLIPLNLRGIPERGRSLM